MKRLTRISLMAGLAVALAGTAGSALFWAVATTGGARWILTTLPRVAGIAFTAQKIEGRLMDRLQLREVRLNLGLKSIELDSLELLWKPLLLLSGTIAVQEATLNGLKIQDNSPPDTTPPVLAWPKVSRSAQLFDATIARLRMTKLSYRRLQEQPVLVTSLSASVTWQDDALTIRDLTVESPSCRIQGSLSAGFNQPFLTSDLTLALTQPVAEMNRFSLLVKRGSSSGPEQFAGKIVLAGSSGTRKLLELVGDVGMARSSFILRRLSLTQPGRKGVLTADGSLLFTTRESLLTLQIKASGLDLAPELKVPTDLAGTLTFIGTTEGYRGDLKLANQTPGWQSASVSATYVGNREGLKLAPLTASVLEGTLAGNLDLDWRKGFAMRGALSGNNLNPARFDPAWKGVANFTAAGNLYWSGTSPVTGSLRGSLLESSLHGQTLTGELQAKLADNNLSVARLVLQGKGFDLHASGELNQRLNLAARVNDFSLLVPGAAGELQAEGWLRWRDASLSGALTGSGSRLAYSGASASYAKLSARLEQGVGYPLHADLSLRDAVYGDYRLNAVSLAVDGTMGQHTLNATLRSGNSEARLTLSAGFNSGTWKGELSRLAGRDVNGPWNLQAPASFSVSAEKFVLSPLAITAGAAEHLEIDVDLALRPMSGQIRAQWTGLNLSRATPWLQEMRITGSSSGTMRLGFLSEKRLTLAGSATASGTFSGQGQRMTIQRSKITFDGNEQGLRAGIELTTADKGSLKGSFFSTAPFSLAMPDRGELTAEMNGIDLAQLRPWLPPDLTLAGHISGKTKGVLLPGKAFELNGTGALSGGTLHRQSPDGELKLAFSAATVSWDWQGETLSGNLSLIMTDRGQARATFQLPLAARFPVAIAHQGPLRATLSGHVQEKGMITALFPGLVQESFGELDTELAVGGTWDAPTITGSARLSKAGSYLPTAGIHLKDVQLAARLEKNRILIDSFRAVSGSGHLEGTALITLEGWRVTGYRGTIVGENFQTVNFPELRILSAPKLSFEGTPQKLTLRGDLGLPELNILSAPSKKIIVPSSDVIREGRAAPTAPASTLVLDVQVRVLLGDKVFVKTAGIDAHLGGAVNLSMSSLEKITSTGEIKVVKGRYRTYGVNLEIVRGRLFFAGGAIDRPALDFLALRTIGNVRAGVTVSGTLQNPVTKLYSEPAMPDVDVLAYIVLGHPLGSSGEQASLVNQAAGALLTSSQAGVLQEQLKDRLGLSTLEIQGGVGTSPGSMGYKPLQVTPPGAIPATQQPGITETMLTVGKYLTPQIYISYGKSLFTGNSQFRLRYDIFKQWQIETQTGTESGADLYYKLEFK